MNRKFKRAILAFVMVLSCMIIMNVTAALAAESEIYNMAEVKNVTYNTFEKNTVPSNKIDTDTVLQFSEGTDSRITALKQTAAPAFVDYSAHGTNLKTAVTTGSLKGQVLDKALITTGSPKDKTVEFLKISNVKKDDNIEIYYSGCDSKGNPGKEMSMIITDTVNTTGTTATDTSGQSRYPNYISYKVQGDGDVTLSLAKSSRMAVAAIVIIPGGEGSSEESTESVLPGEQEVIKSDYELTPVMYEEEVEIVTTLGADGKINHADPSTKSTKYSFVTTGTSDVATHSTTSFKLSQKVGLMFKIGGPAKISVRSVPGNGIELTRTPRVYKDGSVSGNAIGGTKIPEATKKETNTDTSPDDFVFNVTEAGNYVVCGSSSINIYSIKIEFPKTAAVVPGTSVIEYNGSYYYVVGISDDDVAINKSFVLQGTGDNSAIKSDSGDTVYNGVEVGGKEFKPADLSISDNYVVGFKIDASDKDVDPSAISGKYELAFTPIGE